MAVVAAALDRVVVGVEEAMAAAIKRTTISLLLMIMQPQLQLQLRLSLILIKLPLLTEEHSTLSREAMYTPSSSGPQTSMAPRLLPTIRVMATSHTRIRKPSNLPTRHLSSTLTKLLHLLHQRSGIVRLIHSLGARSVVAAVGLGEDMLIVAVEAEGPPQSCRRMTMPSMLK